MYATWHPSAFSLFTQCIMHILYILTDVTCSQLRFSLRGLARKQEFFRAVLFLELEDTVGIYFNHLQYCHISRHKNNYNCLLNIVRKRSMLILIKISLIFRIEFYKESSTNNSNGVLEMGKTLENMGKT